jgi:hypothetical protein
MERIGLVGEARGGDCLVVSLVLQLGAPTGRPQALLPFVVVLGQDGSKLVGQVCNYCKNREASSNSMYGSLMDSGNAGFYTRGIKVSNGRSP